MQIVCLDLEGVLIPEIWIAFAKETGINALTRTTRDEPDYDKLMQYRLNVLKGENIKLDHIKGIIQKLEPLSGARKFLDRIQARGPVVILSDTFEEFAGPLMAKLGFPTLFCHNLGVDSVGKITSYRLRLENHKQKTVEAFRQLNFNVVAVGDSYNDLNMIRAAHKGILFKAPNQIITENPDLPTAFNYDELETGIEAVRPG